MDRLDFMLLAMPRSGTTWAANWLTTDQSVCWHDPLRLDVPSAIDQWPSTKQYRGIACTGSWMWRDWIADHPARRIILDRDPWEINDSLIAIGLPPMTDEFIRAFRSVPGLRRPWMDLFDDPVSIWTALLPDIPFDPERHAVLMNMNIQPAGRVLLPDADVTRRAFADLKTQLEGGRSCR